MLCTRILTMIYFKAHKKSKKKKKKEKRIICVVELSSEVKRL